MFILFTLGDWNNNADRVIQLAGDMGRLTLICSAKGCSAAH